MTKIITQIYELIEPYLTKELFGICYAVIMIVFAIIFRKVMFGGANHAIHRK